MAVDRKPPPRIRPAATVIVLDTVRGEACALMVRRNPTLAFFGGYWVFPGGAIDAGDGPGEVDLIRRAAIAAGRELREEAGLELDPAGFVYWARWITPSMELKRFDTHFFLAAAAPLQRATVAGGEIVACEWLPRGCWSTLSESDPYPVPGPTQLVLREVAEALDRHGSVAACLAGERDRPIHAIMPKMTDRDGTLLPWDPAYAATPGEGLPWDAAMVATRHGWPSRIS